MQQFGLEGIEAQNSAQSIAFVLEDVALFHSTSYMVLQNQDKPYFAACARSRYNGKQKLTYFTREYVSIGDYAKSSSQISTQELLRNLVSAVIDVRENGFLSIQNIVLSADNTFVDAQQDTVKLIYLPVNVPVSGQNDLQACQNVYRLCAAVALISTGSHLFADYCNTHEFENGDLGYLKAALTKGSLAHGPDIPLADSRTVQSYQRTDGSRGPTVDAEDDTGPLRTVEADDPTVTGESLSGDAAPSAAYRLVPVNRQGADLSVFGTTMVLGKSPSRADCVIGLSPAISRRHCRMSIEADGSLWVEDLQSANGTFVGGVRLETNAKVLLEDGSHVQIADVDFLVTRVR